MVVVKISDGFGNQLFMYACGYAVAKRLNQKLFLDASILDNNKKRQLELHHLNIQCEKIIAYNHLKFFPLIKGMYYLKEAWVHRVCKTVKEVHPRQYLFDIEKISGNVYLHGHWMSEKYFKEYRNELLKILTPKMSLSKQGIELAGKMQQTESVAIHVRRTDHLQGRRSVEMSYYDDAIKMIRQRLGDGVTFFVFTDDFTFCKKYFTDEYPSLSIVWGEYQTDNATIDDLFLMSKCKHNIIANSTYSWWAAWLNQNLEKIVVRPEPDGVDPKDYYPEEWLCVKTKIQLK